MVKTSSTKVEAAPASTMKPLKKGKREAEDDLDIHVPKKQKKELIPPVHKEKAVPKKIESSSSDSSDSEEEDKDSADIEMVEAEQKSIAEQPKTPTSQTHGGSKTLFVGNLSYKVERSDVEKFFKEVVDVRFTSDEDGRFKGYGHVEFATAEAAQKALELNGTSLLGRDVRLDLFARERGAPRSSNARNYESGEKGVGSQSKTIFVKGFDTCISEDEIKSDLRAHFGACGEVARIVLRFIKKKKRIVLPTDRETGVIKGMAFIDLKDGYDKALQLRGSEIRGRKIDVQEGRPISLNKKKRKKKANNAADDSAVRFSNNKRGRCYGRRPRVQGRASKPSLIASAQGKKTVFIDDE